MHKRRIFDYGFVSDQNIAKMVQELTRAKKVTELQTEGILLFLLYDAFFWIQNNLVNYNRQNVFFYSISIEGHIYQNEAVQHKKSQNSNMHEILHYIKYIYFYFSK